MDHLLRRVGFKPHPQHTVLSSTHCKETPSEFPGNSLAAYHALNVASNVTSHSFFYSIPLRVIMTVVVYSSKSGSSKKYAESLSARTGLPIYSVGDQPADESIIFFGWLRADTIVGIRGVDTSCLVAVCVVGLDDVGRFDGPKVAEKNGVKVPVYYLRGWIDRSKLNIVEKAVLAWVSAMMKLKGLNEHNQSIFDAMMEGGSFYDEKYLDPIVMFVESKG